MGSTFLSGLRDQNFGENGAQGSKQRQENRDQWVPDTPCYDPVALGWHKLKHQRQVSTAIMMYKTVHGMTPDYLTSKFVSRDEITSYRLRNTENKLVLPLPRTNYLKKSFSYSGAKLWNSLSHDLRSADSLHDFKRKLCRNSFE